jgi:very-short-patch-repair endonuclease
MSPPERALWRILRAHRLEHIKFTRQVECGPFYIDFAARQLRLAIELDGETHVGRAEEDARRTAFLERQG